MIWHLCELTRLHWQNFDSEWLLFDQGTGQTLLVDSVSAAALMALEAGPLAREELERQVARDLALPSLAELSQLLSDNLQFLSDLSLIGCRSKA